MVEYIKVNITAEEVKKLLRDYYKELYNDEDLNIEYRSKFRYVDSNSSVVPYVWGIIRTKVGGKPYSDVISLFNEDIYNEILGESKYGISFCCVDCDIDETKKIDSEKIIFKGLTLYLESKGKSKTK